MVRSSSASPKPSIANSLDKSRKSEVGSRKSEVGRIIKLEAWDLKLERLKPTLIPLSSCNFPPFTSHHPPPLGFVPQPNLHTDLCFVPLLGGVEVAISGRFQYWWLMGQSRLSSVYHQPCKLCHDEFFLCELCVPLFSLGYGLNTSPSKLSVANRSSRVSSRRISSTLPSSRNSSSFGRTLPL